MKRTKVIYTMILIICTIIFVAAVGVVSIATTVRIVEESALKELKLKSVNASLEFDANINSIEQCVNTLCSAATYHLDDFERFKTEDSYVDAYTEELRNLILYSAENTKGALSIYMRFNPEFTDPTSGLFFVRNDVTGHFEEYTTTDFSKYSGNDTIWYDVPVQNEKPTWMEPYQNNYIDYGMISYVVPYYMDGEVVGVIGMDIDYEYMKELVFGIEAYETGYAFLMDKDGYVIVHKDYSFADVLAKKNPMDGIDSLFADEDTQQLEHNNGENTTVYSKTDNNLYLCVTAPDEEIYRDSQTLIMRIIALEILAFLVISIASTIIIKRLFFMSETDELTGIYNRKYFIHMYHDMKAEDLMNYSFFIFDIDCFKGINDTYGHHVGDIAITDVANIAKETLGKEAILARWGGDEFIGIIQSDVAEKRLQLLRETIEKRENEQYGKFTISIGLVKISGSCHFTEFYERADMLLYSSKMNGRNQLIKRD